MKISWQGHASFIIESGGLFLVTDPFDEKVGYPHFLDQADIVTVSHEHYDHYAIHRFKNTPHIVMGPGQFDFGPVRIEGYPSWHDTRQGRDRGLNIIYRIAAEDINIIHLGDLGHIPEQQAEAIGTPDVLMIPVGGTYTLDAEAAWRTVELLEPKIIIPMHYRTPVCNIDIDVLEHFTRRCDGFIKKDHLTLTAAELQGKSGEVLVLDYLS
ncbi:MAG: MBL fold metallo-hydrolase [Syntrophomonadaceae bacterium]|nr:MBL fold metallo-hydrolase [Syntrophomonadaceae bacterium]